MTYDPLQYTVGLGDMAEKCITISASHQSISIIN